MPRKNSERRQVDRLPDPPPEKTEKKEADRPRDPPEYDEDDLTEKQGYIEWLKSQPLVFF